MSCRCELLRAHSCAAQKALADVKTHTHTKEKNTVVARIEEERKGGISDDGGGEA